MSFSKSKKKFPIRRFVMTKGTKLLRNFSLAGFAVVTVLFVGSASLSGQVAGPNRPPDVPEEYVITPFGYFHPSCVLMLAEGDILLADGRVEHADSTVDASAPLCNYPHYTSTGAIVTADIKEMSGIDPTINGWLEYVSTTTSTSYGKISATWIVPPEPTGRHGQTLFFFPGFEDINDVISILQPVLQFGLSAGGGGNYWAVESWNCCINGVTWYSPLLDVSSGDTLIGTIAPTCEPGKDYCPTWNVVSKDKTTGKKTTLATTPADGQVWNWAFGAVSEDYGIVQCDDFPANSGLTFTVYLYDQNQDRIADPGWQGTSAPPGTTPKCTYGVTATETKETVKY